MLDIRNLRTSFVGPASLAVGPGECIAILGPSGVGKSLLLRAIVDLDPNEGEVRLDGTERETMQADHWRQRVAMVPAESGWWADRVADHFDAAHDPGALLEAVGLPEALQWEVARLSSGERHRLAIARALAARPDAILLDEPTATLDDAATERVEAVLKAELARGAAMIVVTHDAAQPGRLNARQYRMAAGRLDPQTEGAA